MDNASREVLTLEILFSPHETLATHLPPHYYELDVGHLLRMASKGSKQHTPTI